MARALLRGFFRDRAALFSTFFFPLMFLVVFGLIFNSASSARTTLGVVGSGPGTPLHASRWRTPH